MEKKKIKTRYIDINVKAGGFVSHIIGSGEKYNFSDIALLRRVLSNEKAKILYVLKHQKITSIYHLSKILERDFKSVYQDLKLLERFGFIEFYSEKKGKRISHIPYLTIDSMQFIINI